MITVTIKFPPVASMNSDLSICILDQNNWTAVSFMDIEAIGTVEPYSTTDRTSVHFR